MADTAASDDEDAGIGIFDEPEGFYQPEKEPTTEKYTTLNGREISLRLVGHNPLWVGETLQASPLFSISSAGSVCATTKAQIKLDPQDEASEHSQASDLLIWYLSSDRIILRESLSTNSRPLSRVTTSGKPPS